MANLANNVEYTVNREIIFVNKGLLVELPINRPVIYRIVVNDL